MERATGRTTKRTAAGLLAPALLLSLAACGGSDSSPAAAAAAWTPSAPEVECPDGYAAVGANPGLGTPAFCVMSFEAKEDADGDPASVAAGAPWTGVTHGDAHSKCAGLSGTGDFADGEVALISNPEWMAAAREIEGVPVNWSGGRRGSGHVPRGHSDGSPGNALAVGDEGDPYDGTGNDAGQDPGSGREQARSHRLRGGGVVWDLAGNVAEWVDWSAGDPGFTWSPAPGLPGELLALSREALARQGDGITRRLEADDVLPKWDYDHAHSHSLGKWFATADETDDEDGRAIRGGYHSEQDGGFAGVYALYINATTDSASVVGFRCVYRP